LRLGLAVSLPQAVTLLSLPQKPTAIQCIARGAHVIANHEKPPAPHLLAGSGYIHVSMRRGWLDADAIDFIQ
jgi:hypothetical protein